jgi:hypothetical protein
MNSMKRKMFGLLVVSATITLAACGGHKNPAKSDADETIVCPTTDAKASVSLKAGRPKEIGIGKANAINLEDYATVKNVDCWSISVDDRYKDIIGIDGHSIYGKSEGSFVVLINAGSVSKSYAGKVVSEDKVEFNNAWSKLSETNNFLAINRIYDKSSGGFQTWNYLYETKDYIVTQKDYVEKGSTATVTDQAITFADAAGHSYEGYYTYTVNAQNQQSANSAITQLGGYSLSPETNGYKKFAESGLTSSMFSEVTITDDDGNETPAFYLPAANVDTAAANNETPDAIDTFIAGFVGRGSSSSFDVSSYTRRYSGGTVVNGLLAYLDESEDGTQHLVLQGMQDQNTFGGWLLALQIGGGNVDVVDTWFNAGVKVIEIEHADLTTFVDTVAESKSYKVTNYARFEEGNGKVITDASRISKLLGNFIENGLYFLFAYQVTSYAASDAVYYHVDSIQDGWVSVDTTKANNGNWSAGSLKTGDAFAHVNKDGKAYDATGTLTANSETGTSSLVWGNATLNAEVTDIWDSVYTITNFQYAVDNGMVNYVSKETNSAGDTVYHWNCALQGETVINALNILGSDDIGYSDLLQLIYNHVFYEEDLTFTLAKDAKSLSWRMPCLWDVEDDGTHVYIVFGGTINASFTEENPASTIAASLSYPA